ncbi:MAG TPA: alanine racemase [Clostridia bacterium]|nr:alanine racemase [Clostridia bacterium]
MHTRPNWAEVSLSALRHNFEAVKRHVSEDVTVCCVIKCDAYGHGVVCCARALEQAGAEWLGVTSVEEAIAVRDAGVKTRILIMTGFWRGEEQSVLRYGLTPAVATLEHLDALERAAESLGMPKHSVPVHLKVDTGMSRLGLPLVELESYVQRLKASPYVVVEGVFSHLASAEVLDAADARQQIERFEAGLKVIEAGGLRPKYHHLANTAATLGRPGAWHNMVRPGLALYGYSSAPNGEEKPIGPLDLRPVLTWKTKVIAMRDVPACQPVGYNGAYVTKSPTRLAVIPVGYGDGFTRHLSSRGRVIVRDQYAPIVGNVSMDLTIVDVTHIAGVEIGDEVILIGSSEHCAVPATEHAKHAGTIVYEILCGLSPRVPRVYVE